MHWRSFLKFRTTRPPVTNGIVERLRRRLAADSVQVGRILLELGEAPEQTERLAAAGTLLAKIRSALKRLLSVADPAEVSLLLQALTCAVIEAIRTEAWPYQPARHVLTTILLHLSEASSQLSTAEASVPLQGTPPTGTTTIIVPTDMIYLAREGLFPAERMFVAGGRRSGTNLRIGALFDVTGSSAATQVNAEPKRLGKALIAMDACGVSLALWLHSHPGKGPGATHPSQIDLQQQKEWIRQFPNLLSAIMVADGWLRFWGTALEKHAISAVIEGAGVTKEKNHEYLYHLDQ